MIFNTPWFLAFFVVFTLALWCLPGAKLRFYFLLGASAVFHGHFAGPAGVAPIVAMGIVVYLLAPRMEAAQGPARKRWLWAGLAVPVLGLIYYKYRAFFIGSLAEVWPAAGPYLSPLAQAGPLPLAISFFTFEFVHYLVDVYKGSPALRRPAIFALFCIYFPSIVSGPIKRYQDFSAQVDDGLQHPAESGQFLKGLAQVVLGFFKKLVIADNATLALSALEGVNEPGRFHVLAIACLLSIRILFDFSGYSDIAIGLSRSIGLRLPANFHYPYAALNPSDFWRRWHMSLSSWIRDYIYIPLGGSQHGPWRRAFNSLAAMALCGLWHGAAWNYVVWGLYHGLGLGIWAAWRSRWPAKSSASPLWGTLLAWCACLTFVAYGWLWFFYPVTKAWALTRVLILGAAP